MCCKAEQTGNEVVCCVLREEKLRSYADSLEEGNRRLVQGNQRLQRDVHLMGSTLQQNLQTLNQFESSLRESEASREKGERDLVEEQLRHATSREALTNEKQHLRAAEATLQASFRVSEKMMAFLESLFADNDSPESPTFNLGKVFKEIKDVRCGVKDIAAERCEAEAEFSARLSSLEFLVCELQHSSVQNPAEDGLSTGQVTEPSSAEIKVDQTTTRKRKRTSA